MNLKLEELRKRLLEPMPTNGAGNTVYRRSFNEPYSSPPSLVHQPIVEADIRGPEAVVSEPSEVEESPALSPVEGRSTTVSKAVLHYVKQAAASAPEEETMEPNTSYQVASAVAKVFEQTRNFEDRFGELEKMLAPIESASQAAVRSFEPLRNFEKQISQLAQSFEPMRSFQNQLAELAQTFEPMKGLQQQLSQLSEAFQVHLERLSRSMEPAKEFQHELLKLASAFDSAVELQSQFQRLAETFKAGASPLSGVVEAETQS